MNKEVVKGSQEEGSLDLKALRKELHKAIKRKHQENPEAVFEGDLANGVRATNITIRKINAMYQPSPGGGILVARILPEGEKSPHKEFFSVFIENFNMQFYVFKCKENLFAKNSYYFLCVAFGDKYRNFMDQNHNNHFDISSAKSMNELLNNVKRWRKNS